MTPSIDYIVGDSEEVSRLEAWRYSEKIERLPLSYLTFDVRHRVPPVVEAPCRRNGYLVFGSPVQYKITFRPASRDGSPALVASYIHSEPAGGSERMTLRIDIPSTWTRRGLVLRGEDDGWGGFVVGDPCVVRDDEAGLWRMFLFALPPGHGHAVCEGIPDDPGAWRAAGPLEFTNPDLLAGTMIFKPFVVLDAARPGCAARIGGHFALLLGTDHEAKVVRRAWATSLAGPWTIEDGILLDRGNGDDFDAKHVDAASAFVFSDRAEILYFYMGYPLHAQAHATSPLGSSQGAALESLASAAARAETTMRSGMDTRRSGTKRTPGATPPAAVRKLGCILPPSQTPGHWASGWVGGLQLLRGRSHRWIGLVNASPTAPRAQDDSMSHEEPPPSLGGFAVCDEEFPVSGWRWCDAPIEWTADVPPPAREAGEIVNFWRHHALVLEDGRVALFYNAGDYFHEKLFLKVAPAPAA